ncbi:MAG: MipA/OmpV family protein [Pseudomonadota bacterium]
MNRLLRCCAAALVATSGAVQAQQLPLWELGVFGGAATTPAYPGSSDRSTRALALPFILYRGEVLRVDQQGIGARLLRSERIELDVGLAASLPARSSDVAARAGMPNLGVLLEAGPRVKVTLARPDPGSRIRLDLPLRSVIEARSGVRSQGWTFEPKIVYESNAPGEKWTFDANLGMVFGERKVNGYFYEVLPQYATLERPAYRADAGLMLVRAGISGSRMLGHDLRVFGFVRYESYAGAANRDSPLMQKRTGTSAGVAFAWTFKRSAQLAR